MSERELGTFQMLWDCPSCETKKLLGLDHRHCPNCGAAQDPSRRYFPSDQDKVAVVDHCYTGADRRCPACESPMSRLANNCASCGSPLAEGQEVARRGAQTARAGQSFDTDTSRRAADELRARKEAARRDGSPGSTSEGSSPTKRGKTWLILGAIAAVVIGLVVLLTWKKPVEVEVIGHEWSRVIALEEYRGVAESAWRNQLPSGAYDVACHREQRSTKKIADGETCDDVREDNGDGTFRVVRKCRTKYREEPVYDERCSYRINRWVEGRRLESFGGSLSDGPRWPEAKLARTGQCLGCEREGRRTETYRVRFRLEPSGDEDSCEYPEARWRALQVGRRLPAKARVVGGGLDCGSVAE